MWRSPTSKPPPHWSANGSRSRRRNSKPTKNRKMATKTKKPVRKAKKTTAPVKKKPLTKAQKLKREIAKRNRLFAAADPAEKRVLIAKDVIAQIKLGRYKAATQTWVSPVVRGVGGGYPLRDTTTDLLMEFGADASMRELFLNKQIQACECCALGAMFMSCTLYNNNQTVEDFEEETNWEFDERVDGRHGGFSNGLHKFFSRAQLALIEAAYEGGIGAFEAPTSKQATVYKWADNLPDDKKRLVAIMENIIENEGTFVP